MTICSDHQHAGRYDAPCSCDDCVLACQRVCTQVCYMHTCERVSAGSYMHMQSMCVAAANGRIAPQRIGAIRCAFVHAIWRTRMLRQAQQRCLETPRRVPALVVCLHRPCAACSGHVVCVPFNVSINAACIPYLEPSEARAVLCD